MTAVIIKPASLRERKKAAARARIVASAVRIFSQRGIEQATVEEIAAAADVGKGTVYNHFQSKEEIVVAFLLEIEAQVEGRVRRYATARGSLQEILGAFLRFQLRLKRPYHSFVRVFFMQVFASGSARSPWMRQMQEAINPPLRFFFATLRDRGLIREDIDVVDLIQLFKMLHVGLMTVWVMEGPPWRVTHHLLKQQMQVFCEGIERRAH